MKKRNDFIEISKNLAKSENNIVLDHQNNYIRNIMSNTTKKF